MESTTLSSRFSRTGHLYRYTALLVINTLIALIIINICLYIVLAVKDAYESRQTNLATMSGLLFNPDGSPVDNGKRNSYQLKWIDRHAYGNISDSYVSQVLDESYDLAALGMAYQAWVEFAEPEFHGRLVNVDRDELGILQRRTINPTNVQQWPIVKIFAFGGSTTFGYNVSDEQTWPTYLSKVLNGKAQAASLQVYFEVVNYGRGFYYPSQETALLLDLLRLGHRPQLAIFLDGVNSSGSEDVPEFYPQLKERFRNIQFAKAVTEQTPILQAMRWIPMVRMAQSVHARLFRKDQITVAQREAAADLNESRYKINSWRQNRAVSELIANLYSARAMFFLQPNAAHNYNTDLYRTQPLPPEFFNWRTHATQNYAAMKNDPNLIYLGDLFEQWGRDKKAIIDELHYSPGFNEFLANKIAERINVRDFNPRRASIDKAAASGARKES